MYNIYRASPSGRIQRASLSLVGATAARSVSPSCARQRGRAISVFVKSPVDLHWYRFNAIVDHLRVRRVRLGGHGCDPLCVSIWRSGNKQWMMLLRYTHMNCIFICAFFGVPYIVPIGNNGAAPFHTQRRRIGLRQRPGQQLFLRLFTNSAAVHRRGYLEE